ncbi:hypothetical protein ASE03_21495 [Kitasatospora sp. Root187]|nr:hypothetical protein ASC99_26825 [Kitasatospora sp. Root107]KRB73760.1 hypothetical protein ASE03_21495 [Kitasatospora sp. Root187]
MAVLRGWLLGLAAQALGEQWEKQDGEHARADQGCGGGGRQVLGLDLDGGDDHDQRQGGGAEQAERHPVPAAQFGWRQQCGRDSAQRGEQQQEDRDEQQGAGIGEERIEVEFIPLTTKKIGTRKPKPMPSSLASITSSSASGTSDSSSREMIPAVKAPSSMSRLSQIAALTITASTRITVRIANWPEVRRVRRISRVTTSGRGRRA